MTAGVGHAESKGRNSVQATCICGRNSVTSTITVAFWELHYQEAEVGRRTKRETRHPDTNINILASILYTRPNIYSQVLSFND